MFNFKKKIKPKHNYSVSAWGTTSMGDVKKTSKTFYAKTEKRAKRLIKRFAENKEWEIFQEFPNFSIYTDGSYPNSIGVAYSWKTIK